MFCSAWGRALFRLLAGLLFTISFSLVLSGCATGELWDATRKPELLGFEVIVPASDVQPRYVDWKASRPRWEAEKGRLELGSDACAEHVFIEHLRRPPDNKIAPGEVKEVWARSAESFSARGMIKRAELAECETLLTVLRFDEKRTTSLIAVEATGEERGRVDIKQPLLPQPWAWPLIPVAVAFDVVTSPIQLLLMWYFASAGA